MNPVRKQVKKEAKLVNTSAIGALSFGTVTERFENPFGLRENFRGEGVGVRTSQPFEDLGPYSQSSLKEMPKFSQI